MRREKLMMLKKRIKRVLVGTKTKVLFLKVACHWLSL